MSCNESFRITGLLKRLAVVAVVAVASSYPFAASHAQCAANVAGTIVTCTGDVHDGVAFFNPPYTELDVKNLTAPIAPNTGVAGISFTDSTGASSITVNVDTTGTTGILTDDAPAIAADELVQQYTGPAIAGSIFVRNAGSIATSGISGFGIIATTTAQTLDPGAVAEAGSVTVTNSGAISLAGQSVYGILAFSSAETACGCSGTAVTGSVVVNNSGAISATGDDAVGILAATRTLGSSGNEHAGEIVITNSADITASGFNAVAIGASSIGGSSDISINITGGTVTGGIGCCGVLTEGGNAVVNNFGTVTTVEGINGLAILNENGSSAIINNHGTVTGSVLLDNDSNAFNNLDGGLLNSGTDIRLWFGGTLTNSGTISPGGNGTVLETDVTGNLVQTGKGKFAADLDLSGGQADFISLSGTASLAGSVVATVDSLKAGPQSFTILSATGGTTNNALALVASPALQAQLLYPNANDVALTTDLDFSAPRAGLNANQTAIATTLESAFLLGGGGLSPALLGLANTPGTDLYKNALDQLSPEIMNYAVLDALFASQQFANDMLSCRVAGDDGASFIREGQCLWVRGRARILDIDPTHSNIGSDTTAGSFSAGTQLSIAPDIRFGFAAGYDRIRLDTDTGAASDGDRANVGAIVKYNPGPILLAAGVTAGWGSFDTTRALSFGGFNAVASSSNDVAYVSGQLHAAYLATAGLWYVKPMIDAALTDVHLGGFDETGGGGAALTVAGHATTVASVSPAMEVGTERRFDDISVWRPFIRAGVTWQDTDRLQLDGGFLAAPETVAPFVISTKFDSVLADVTTGVDVINRSGAVLRLQYDGRFGQITEQSSVSFKGSVPF